MRKYKKNHENVMWLCFFAKVLSCLLCLCVKDVQTSKNIFHGSSLLIEKIIQTEKGVGKAVQEYVSSLERRLVLAKRYMEDYEETEKLTNDDILFNPLRLFRLIRRLTLTLPHLQKELHRDYERKFHKTLENTRKGADLPEQSDLDAAIEGLIRVQDAYDLNVNSFARGDFDGLPTNTSLNAADCFLIGSYSLTANIYTRAVEWLERALDLVLEEYDNSIPAKTVRNRLQDAMSKHNAALQMSDKQNPYVFREKIDIEQGVEVRVTRKKKILDKISHQLYTTKSSFTDLTNFAALCRGEMLQGYKIQKMLKCWLDSSSANTRISPLRVEMLHRKPPVIQIYDIIPSKLCHKIISVAQRSTLQRSKVHGMRDEFQGAVSASRTSSSTWLLDENTLKSVEKVYPRLNSLFGLDLRTPGACEEFQVASYSTTAHYNPHTDNLFGSSEIDKKGKYKDELEKGDRLATLMFYLSDVPRGGMTAFPRLGIAAKPVKGSAVFWFNVKRNGEPDELSLHGGCPILYGNKWIGNQWIRANSQMFEWKCSETERVKLPIK